MFHEFRWTHSVTWRRGDKDTARRSERMGWRRRKVEGAAKIAEGRKTGTISANTLHTMIHINIQLKRNTQSRKIGRGERYKSSIIC